MNEVTRQSPRAGEKALQIIVGLIVGFVFTWALWQIVPVESGRSMLAIAVVVSAIITVALVVWVRRLLPAAIAFAVASALLDLLLGLVVVG